MYDAYTSIAPVYDAVTKGFLTRPHQQVVQLCQQLQAKRVLDAGCGTGQLATAFAGSDIQYVGLDASKAMLKKARLLLSSANTKPPAFICGNALCPPFNAQAFDVVIFSMILHETDCNPVHLLEKAFTLAPQVIIVDWKVSTRNLDYLLTFWRHAIERAAGKNHYAHFRTFLRAGGIRGLAQRTNAVLRHEKHLHGRSISLALLSR